MLRRSSHFKMVLAGVVAATMAWDGPANAALLLNPDGTAALGIRKKTATDNAGNENPLLFVTQIFVRFDVATDVLLAISNAKMSTKNGTPFHQDDIFGTDFAPGQGIVDALPSVAFDSFITINYKTIPVGEQDAASPDGDWGILGFQGSQAQGGWFAIPDSGQGQADFLPGNLKDGVYWVLIAQLTVENVDGNGVQGILEVNWQNAAGDVATVNASFNNQVPSPGALALLGLAGLVGVRRRRRR